MYCIVTVCIKWNEQKNSNNNDDNSINELLFGDILD